MWFEYFPRDQAECEHLLLIHGGTTHWTRFEIESARCFVSLTFNEYSMMPWSSSGEFFCLSLDGSKAFALVDDE